MPAAGKLLTLRLNYYNKRKNISDDQRKLVAE